MSIWQQISDHISDVTQRSFCCQSQQSGQGGCINDSYVIGDGEQRYFAKLNRRDLGHMFAAEAAGLLEIHNSHSIRVPEVICHGEHGDTAYLILQHISFGHGDDQSHQQLGQQLAGMHQHSAEQFGWWRDNTIGSTSQHNQQSSHWCDFWRQQRLGYQLQLCTENGYDELETLAQPLLSELEVFFQDYSPQASLLHGDLWSGNYAFDHDGSPVVFDPAVYYGDRETDLAMTELFGGFPPAFYHAYNQAWPLDRGYTQRKTLYNLYHILNHVNLFGAGYAHQAQAMIHGLVKQL